MYVQMLDFGTCIVITQQHSVASIMKRLLTVKVSFFVPNFQISAGNKFHTIFDTSIGDDALMRVAISIGCRLPCADFLRRGWDGNVRCMAARFALVLPGLVAMALGRRRSLRRRSSFARSRAVANGTHLTMRFAAGFLTLRLRPAFSSVVLA